MIRLSPHQRAAVDQAGADIRESLPGSLDVARQSPAARLLCLTVIDDVIADPQSAFGRLLAWKELLGP